MSSEDSGAVSRDRRRHSTHIRSIIVGGTLPVAIGLAATLLMASWIPELPDPIAVHWSGAGPDGFGPAVPYLFMPLAFVVVYSVFAVMMSWKTTPSGSLASGQKLVLVAGVWMSTMLGIGIGGSVEFQRGLSDAKDAPDVGITLAIGGGVGLVVAAVAWFLLPPADEAQPSGAVPKSVDLRGGERLSWSHSTRFGNGTMAILGVVIALTAGIAIFAAMSSRPAAGVAIVALAVVAVSVVSMSLWRVSADHRGFIVRGAMGWPSKRILLADIRTVQVLDVHPMRDFGGYGWRWSGGGRSGVILRTGPGIEITSSRGKRFVVTVDDAETGAGVIAAVLKKQTSRAE